MSADLEVFHPATARWFEQVFPHPTAAQRGAWPPIARGENTLLLAPTGSGKTLAAFLVAIDRIMFGTSSDGNGEGRGVRTLYISPLKALGVDVERNLRSPLAGVRAAAQREGYDYRLPAIGVRSGDTPAAQRHRMTREPPDILITTPESLFLMLTSQAREILRTVETVIVDEIHSLVATKRGAHLFISLERLERLRREAEPQTQGSGARESSAGATEPAGGFTSSATATPALQRIGLSATQRPLEEVARLLGGGVSTANPNEPPMPRPVTIVEAGRRKQLQLRIEVPVEDMARLAQQAERDGDVSNGPTLPSIWPSIHPRLVELIREHRSTMIFVNSRRLAERLAAAINELAAPKKEAGDLTGEQSTKVEPLGKHTILAAAHHGSIAKDQRREIEDRLKRGQLPAIVATSSLELGIDMGAVDLVIQLEARRRLHRACSALAAAGIKWANRQRASYSRNFAATCSPAALR